MIDDVEAFSIVRWRTKNARVAAGSETQFAVGVEPIPSTKFSQTSFKCWTGSGLTFGGGGLPGGKVLERESITRIIAKSGGDANAGAKSGFSTGYTRCNRRVADRFGVGLPDVR